MKNAITNACKLLFDMSEVVGVCEPKEKIRIIVLADAVWRVSRADG